jgi:transcription termination/antitermination protein NusG
VGVASQSLFLVSALGSTLDFRSAGEGPAHAAIVEAIYLAEGDMQFDDTRATRIHRKEEAATARENTARHFTIGKDVIVTDAGNPFATFSGIVDEITKSGRVIALIELFGRMTPAEFDAAQLSAA